MKRIISLMTAALLMACMVSCSGDKKDLSAQTSSPDTTEAVRSDTTAVTTALTETSSSETDGGDVATTSAVSVKTENYKHGENDVTIMYPVFGDGAHDAFDTAMRDMAVMKFNQSGVMSEDGSVYEITLCDVTYVSDSLVSAVVSGLIVNADAAHPAHVSYTVNGDPATGKIYTSDELVGDIDLIKSALAEGRFTQTYGLEGLLSEFPAEDLTQSWRADYGIFPDMYFTEDSFGVMAELVFALGGYACFEISIEDADGMINDTAIGLLADK